MLAFCEQTSDEKQAQNASDQVLMEIVLKRLESQTCDIVCRYRLHDQLSLYKGMLMDDLDSGVVDEEMEREDSSIQEKLDMENKGLQQ